MEKPLSSPHPIPTLDHSPIAPLIARMEIYRQQFNAWLMASHLAKHYGIALGKVAPGSLPYIEIERWITDHGERWEAKPDIVEGWQDSVVSLLHGSEKPPFLIPAYCDWIEAPEAWQVSTRPSLNKAATFARYMQELAGNDTFTLSCRDLGAILDTSQETAAKYLRALCDRGLLQLVQKGTYNPHGISRASEYRIPGRLTQDEDPNTYNRKPTAQAPEIVSEEPIQADSKPDPVVPGSNSRAELVDSIMKWTGEGPKARPFWLFTVKKLDETGKLRDFLKAVRALKSRPDIQNRGAYLNSVAAKVLQDAPTSPPAKQPRTRRPKRSVKLASRYEMAACFASLLGAGGPESGVY